MAKNIPTPYSSEPKHAPNIMSGRPSREGMEADYLRSQAERKGDRCFWEGQQDSVKPETHKDKEPRGLY